MALVESAGAAFTGNNTAVSATTASFTPAANSLICLIACVGNNAGAANTGLTVSGTGFFSGATWTRLAQMLNSGGGGGGAVWVLDAGASPSAGTVTVTIAGGATDIALIVRQFAGANPAARQNGVTATASGTIGTIGITPMTAGSQVVGAYGTFNGSGLGLAANGSTTIYGTGQNTTGGSTFLAFEANALSTAGTALTLGVTPTEAGTGMVAAEILPSGISSSDTGTGRDAQGPVGISAADGGAGSESATLPPISFDAGTGTETGRASAAVADADSGSGADGQQQPLIVSADTGTGADSQQQPLIVSADTGTGADAQGSIYLASSDTGTGADSTLPQPVASSDTGTGADSQLLMAASSDTGTGAEAGQMAYVPAGSETGAGSDSQGTGLAGSDAGTGSEVQQLTALLPGSDTGTGTEAQSLMLPQLSSSDTGAGAEGWSIGLAGSDTGAGSDAQGSILLASSDTGTGSESQSFTSSSGGGTFFVSDSDKSHGQEGDIEPAVSADAGTGAEGTGYLVQVLAAADTGTGADVQSVLAAVTAVADSDAGTGGESWVTSGTHADADTGTGADGQAGTFLFAQADAAAGAEGTGAIGIFPFPPPWVFAAGGGVYHLVWRPGTAEERVLRVFERLEPWVFEYERMIRYSGALFSVSGSDGGSGGEASLPVATVHQYATGARVSVEVMS